MQPSLIPISKLQVRRGNYLATGACGEGRQNVGVGVFRNELNAAVDHLKVGTTGMIAGKGLSGARGENTFSWDRCGAIDSEYRREQVVVDPLIPVIRAGFATRNFPDHQGVAGAIEYIANSDG